MVEFLKKRKSIEMMEGVYEVSFLLIDNVTGGFDVFELVICLIGLI